MDGRDGHPTNGRLGMAIRSSFRWRERPCLRSRRLAAVASKQRPNHVVGALAQAEALVPPIIKSLRFRCPRDGAGLAPAGTSPNRHATVTVGPLTLRERWLQLARKRNKQVPLLWAASGKRPGSNADAPSRPTHEQNSERDEKKSSHWAGD